ncbi:MAG TPA: glycosyltransferase family 2 protein [Flavobacteriaceae bacterium]|nr:glycosyltransferase family 2 protein [Flavobacteriaceae bacterium]
MRIAVVILNWNGKELLRKFLPSVVSFSPEATVYMADNASTDGSAVFVKQNFPQVKIIQNIQNGGYAKGYNDALSQLSEEIFILLNSDVAVTENWLPPLISCFENQSKTAAVQPKILDYHRKNYFEYAGAAGGFLDRLAFPYCRGRIFEDLEEDRGQYDDEVPIFWASGACLAVRKSVFYEAGKLDENYFAHQEEIDLCWRMRNLGYTIKYIGKSKVFHVGGATLSSENPQKTFYNFRNSLFNLVKNDSGKFHFFLVVLRLSLDGIAAVRFLFQGKPKHFGAVFKAHLSFYKSLPILLKKRKIHPKKSHKSRVFSIVFEYYILGKKTFSALRKQS